MDSMVSKMIPIFKAYGVKKASLFGSVARGEDRPDSDVDILVEFDKTKPMGMFKYVQFGLDLEDRVGRKVDVVSRLNKYIEPYVINDLRVIYDQG